MVVVVVVVVLVVVEVELWMVVLLMTMVPTVAELCEVVVVVGGGGGFWLAVWTTRWSPSLFCKECTLAYLFSAIYCSQQDLARFVKCVTIDCKLLSTMSTRHQLISYLD